MIDGIPEFFYRRSYYNHKYRFIYILNPKAMCSSWRWFVLQLNEKDFNYKDIHCNMNSNLLTIPENEKGMVKDYFKFSFVRHPSDRIKSFFLNKLVYNHNFFDKLGKISIKNETLTKQHIENLTFNSFINDISKIENKANMDFHVKPQVYNIKKKMIKYDFIGKMENPNDIEFVLDTLKISSEDRKLLGHHNKTKEGLLTGNFADKTIKELRNLKGNITIKNLFNHKTELKIKEVYNYDYRLFNYD